MFQVSKKPNTPNMIWDANQNSPLCKFVDGFLETKDKKLADRLKALGHTVTEIKEQGGEANGGAG